MNNSFSMTMSEIEEAEDLNLRLIESVKEFSYLYTKGDKRYLDRNAIDFAWTSIAETLSITKEDAKERWTRLRNNFVKSLSRRCAKLQTGPSTSQPIKVKSWTYEAEMDFLKDHLTSKLRPVTSSQLIKRQGSPSPALSPSDQTTSPGGPEEEEEDYSHPSTTLSPRMIVANHRTPFTFDPTPIMQPKAKKAKTVSEDLTETMLGYMKTVTSEREEPLIGWFKTLLPTLKTFPQDKLLSFQITVMQEMQTVAAEVEYQKAQEMANNAVLAQASSYKYDHAN